MKRPTLTLDIKLAASLALAALFMGACSPQSEPEPASPTSNHNSSTPASTVAGSVCAAHEAPKALCFICDASLRESGRLWCNEHARYEDRCWLCHPELEDKTRLYCKEHSLYEDECFFCHPELLPTKEPSASLPDRGTKPQASTSGGGLMCLEHGVLEEDCGICHPELLMQSEMGQGLKVRLPAETSAERAGITLGHPRNSALERGIDCLAELTFDLNRMAVITPLVDGIVQSVEADLGSRVHAGDVLATVNSVAIGEAQSAYLQALTTHQLRQKAVDRERTLREQHISSQKDLQEAEAAYQAAAAVVRESRQRLTVFGFGEDQIEGLAAREMTPGVLELRAPFAGEIVERQAVRGAMAAIGTPLLTLVDTSRLWAMVNIPESQLSQVREGQTAQLTVASMPGKTFEGTLTWISAKVDEHTRMVHARVEVANMDGSLKARMFARARLVEAKSSQALLVPQGALQNVTGIPVVFIASERDLFEARPVKLGSRHPGGVEVLAGLQPGERVVMEGAYALKSQFLISRLGAGCVH